MIYDESKYSKIIVDKKKRIQELNCTIALPSTMHTYSVITEYIKNWILNKLPGVRFNSVHVEGKHVYHDFKKLDLSSIVRKPLPLLVIKPSIELEYNRDLLDDRSFGLDTAVRTGRLNNSFVRDYKNEVFIGHAMELLNVDYSILIKVETKAQQIDLYKYITYALRCGHRQEEVLDINYHIPRTVLIQYAMDNKFKLKYNDMSGDYDIVDTPGFLKFVNGNSLFPIIYSMRGVNGKSEFFLRMQEIDIEVTPSGIDPDDGERIGMLTENYVLGFTINVKCPTVQSYYYYSSNAHKIVSLPSFYQPSNGDVLYPIACFKLERIPDVNSRGWNRYVVTDYHEDDTSKPLSIEFKPLLDTGVDMYRAIQEFVKTGVDIDSLIEFKIYNGDKQYSYKVDWEKSILTTHLPVKEKISTIALYMDMGTINQKIIELNEMDKVRVLNTKNSNRIQ